MIPTARDAAKLPPYSLLSEPLLAFAHDDPQARDTHPLRGLKRFGPYTRAALASYTPQIRVATVGPVTGRGAVRELVGSLRRHHAPSDRTDYVPPFPGFAKLFGIELVPAAIDAAHLTWPGHLSAFAHNGAPHDQVAAALSDAIRRLDSVRDHFDVVTVHLPDAWAPGLKTTTFDAHDTLKVLAAAAGIPTQVLNDRAFAFRHRASLAWRLSIALYVKAGGVPWKLACLPGVPNDTAYIGLAYALRGDPRDARFVTCCSQVFDADGGGMQFVAYEARDPLEETESDRGNPYLTRADMRAVLARSLRLYQSRNGGALPRRVVIHKQTRFRDDELAGASDALAAVDELECIEVTENVAWRGVWLRASRDRGRPSEPDDYPVRRGVMLPITGTSALLWAAGNAPDVSSRGNFYQGGKSIPRPLLLTRHAGSGALEVPALEALALTKMDWNNDALYDPVPVTIRYARQLARTIANVPTLGNDIYPYRLFM
jgi:hypothetical protein